jgi:hypothetical protein
MKEKIIIGFLIIVCLGRIFVVEILDYVIRETKIFDMIFPLNYYETDKVYYYDSNKEYCITIITYPGNFEEPYEYDGYGEYIRPYRQGTYVMPYKFDGFLPDTNYIRLDYIGAIDDLYYKWQDDTLYFRTMDYGIIDNQLSSKVVLDSKKLDYERWGRYRDTTLVMDQYLEWKKMKAEYSVIKSPW